MDRGCTGMEDRHVYVSQLHVGEKGRGETQEFTGIRSAWLSVSPPPQRLQEMSLSACQSPDDGLYGSWVELEGFPMGGCRESVPEPQSSATSLLQGELERILQDAQLDCERSSHTDSLSQVWLPQMSPESVNERQNKDPSKELSERTCLKEGRRKVGVEPVREWPSRPESSTPKKLVFQRMKQPSLSERKSVVMKTGVLIPSLLTSHLLTLWLGIYIGKRLAASSSTL
ncbi:hypothetical protein AGOR_G00046870 [Albula goreensis]|uniref:Uncharacterized protein n=1 Tax=Albula goreensis TaxID=1534307 RepID=A0A8T3DTG3_9TELE|nr:hypothetical protein AGOR_G00046870 [Albula goreensis]